MMNTREEQLECNDAYTNVMSVEYEISVGFRVNLKLNESERLSCLSGDTPDVSVITTLENDIRQMLIDRGFYYEYAYMEAVDKNEVPYDPSKTALITDYMKAVEASKK